MSQRPSRQFLPLALPPAGPALRRLQATQSTTGSVDGASGRRSGRRAVRIWSQCGCGSTMLRFQSPFDPPRDSAHDRRSYFLNLAWPDFPSAVLMVNVIVAPAAIAFFASPFSEFSPWGTSVTVSRPLPPAISTAAVKPFVETGFGVFGTKTLMVMVFPAVRSSASMPASR